MFLPIGDAPNPRATPVVTWALIALNVAVFLFVTLPLAGTAPDPGDPALRAYLELLRDQLGRPVSMRELAASVSAYDVFVVRWGFRPSEGSFTTLFTSMFLHGGFMHLAGNMLFLWIYGDNVEHRLGRGRYLLAYLGTGAAATLFHALNDLSSSVPMVGASGAISGVLGFYFLLFPRNVVKVLIAFFPFLVDVVQIPARIVLGFYIVLSNILPFMAGGAGSGVAYGAHIGGFFAGLGAAWVIDRRERHATPREYRAPRPKPASAGRPSVADEVGALVRSGRYSEAAEGYFAAPDDPRHLPEPREALRLGRWLADNGHPSAALTIFRRLMRAHPTGQVAADAHLGAGLVQLRDLGRPTSAYQHFLDVIDLAPGTEAARLAEAGLVEIGALRPGRRRR